MRMVWSIAPFVVDLISTKSTYGLDLGFLGPSHFVLAYLLLKGRRMFLLANISFSQLGIGVSKVGFGPLSSYCSNLHA